MHLIRHTTATKLRYGNSRVQRSVVTTSRGGPVLRQHGSILKTAATPGLVERVAVNTDDVVLISSKSSPLYKLADMATDGSLQLQAESDNLVWNYRKMASNLVLPVIQGKDTPPIMLEASDEGGRLHALGGTPRLASLLAFVTGSTDLGGQDWPSAPVELDARDTAFPRWNGKTFKQLPEDAQQRVRHYPVTCLLVERKPQA